MKKSGKPPKTLSVEARRMWSRMLAEYDLADEAGLMILQTGLEAFDRMRGAQAAILKDGIVVRDRWGQTKPHPAASIERDSRAQYLGALKQLNLDMEPLRDGPGRPGGNA